MEWYIAHYIYFEFWNQQKHKIILQRHVGLNGHLLVEISFTTGSIFFSRKSPSNFWSFFLLLLRILLLLHIVGCRTSWDRFVHWVWSQRTMIWILKWSCLIFSKFSKKIMLVCCFVIPDPIWMLLFETI